jgi:hypothetical protein
MSDSHTAMQKHEERAASNLPTEVTSSLPAPTGHQAELDRFRQAAVRNTRFTLMGQGLRFRKGDWLFGSDKQKIADGTRFTAIMGEARNGWIKWNADKTSTNIVGKIADGFEPPPLETLDCRDEAQWPIGLDGKKQDPWRPVVYLPLVSMDGEQLLTFTSATKTGRPAFWKLVDRYAWAGRKHPGQYPIIEIQATGYQDKRFGWIDTPSFKIVGWTDRPNVAQLTGDGDGGDDTAAEATELRDEMEDEIPF